jgi:hypothetical protein
MSRRFRMLSGGHSPTGRGKTVPAFASALSGLRTCHLDAAQSPFLSESSSTSACATDISK